MESHGWKVDVQLRAALIGETAQWNQYNKPAGWYASGGNFIVDRPTVIGVGEGGRREHVQITPEGQSRGGDIVIQFLGDIYANSPQQAEQVGRGLGRGIKDEMRARGMSP